MKYVRSLPSVSVCGNARAYCAGAFLRNRLIDTNSNGQIAVAQHRPVEQRPGRAAVAVLERVVEGEPEVQQDGANDGVHEGAVVGVPIRELHHPVQAVWKLLRRRRVVQHLVVGVAHLDAVVLRAAADGRPRPGRAACPPSA